MSDEAFKSGPDLEKTEELVPFLVSLAGGMKQQSLASDVNSGLSGHPFPSHLYLQVSQALEAAAKMLTPLIPVPVPEPVTPPQAGSVGASATMIVGDPPKDKSKR